ncbi:MAG TPA: MMPL family transporter [Gaiellaceae bacterium]|nr:MMPL family transporter [Gaiellaceae bacterium]
MLARIADLIDRRPGRVLAVALVIAAVAAVFGIHVREHLKPRGFEVPGSSSERARELIASTSGTDPGNSVLALVRLPAPYGTPRARATIQAVEERLRRDLAVVTVLDAANAHNPAMIGRDRRSTYLVAALRVLDDKQQEDAGKRLLAAFADDSSVTLGGNPVANHEISTTIENDLRRAELLAVPLIVLLSFFLFRGFIASLLAPLAGGITIVVSFFLLRELASVTSLSIYALNLVTGLSLGLSIDWSLLLLSRYREERAQTDDLRLALRRALPRAGHTIVFSALTVAASLACLLVFPLRFLRSMGYGGIVASSVAMLTALIVLPTVLRLLGPRIDALSLPRWRDPSRLAKPGRHWRALGQLTTRYPIPVATAVTALLLLLAVPIGRIAWTTVDASSLPSSAQAFQADRTINRSSEFVRNGGTPFYLALQTPSAAAARALANQARRLDGVRAVAPPRRLSSNTWQLNLVSADTPYSAPTQRLVRQLGALDGSARLYVGGDAAAFHDERHAIASNLPIAIVILAAATLIILFLLTASLVAPLLALAMNALTLAAAFGILILIFQDGRFESLLDYTGQGALDLTIPLVLAALVFAISTDYGVFLLSRVREARISGQNDRQAIAGSVAIVGRIVTAAAVLFAVSIGAFGSSNVVVLKILGIGTAVAVLADALLVRCLLLPASLRLVGPGAWWLPTPIRRLHGRMSRGEPPDPSPAPRRLQSSEGR